METSRLVKWIGSALILPLALAIPNSAYAATSGTGGTGGTGGTSNSGGSGGTFGVTNSRSFDRVPILVYTVASQSNGASGTGSSTGGTGSTGSTGTGSTGTSLADYSLVVYSDGLVTLSGAGLASTTNGSQETAITTQQAFNLMRVLRQAGGLRHRSTLTTSSQFANSPVTTVSVFFYPNVQGFLRNNNGGNGNGNNGSGNGNNGNGNNGNGNNGSGNGNNGNGNGNSSGLFSDSSALVNTFSYYAAQGTQTGMDSAIQSFLTEFFPDTFSQQ